MADGRLLRAQFRKRQAERRVEKDRIVTEPAIASRFGRNPAFNGAAGFKQDRVAGGERERADKPRGAPAGARPAQRVVNERELVGIRHVDAAKPRRRDAGGAAERVDLEAGILRDSELAASSGVVERLVARVLRKRGPGLLGRGNLGPFGQGDKVEPHAFQ